MMMKSERDLFAQKIPVSHETMAKLDRYAALLAEWNQKFNLVAESTIPHIWTRHILDSAQLYAHVPPKAQNFVDMGSGAGFPALVLSIMGAPHVHMIESTGKKANFLRTVADELGLAVTIHQTRIEEIKGLTADVLTARALGPLPELLKLGQRFMTKDTLCLFLKGRNGEAELTESAKRWTFSCEKLASISDDSGIVLILKDVHFKHVPARQKHRA